MWNRPWILLLLLTGFSSPLLAGEGDTTWVRGHDLRDLVWNEAYDDFAEFPDGSTSYGRILLYFTLGCASSGCSDWDYTVLVSLVDTSLGQEYELGRCITPYGGYMRNGLKGFNNDWQRTYVYDVTDFAHMLQDRQKLRIYYDGWSSGFSGTLDFALIEGTPAREVLGVQSLYHSGAGDWSYSNSTDFESAHLPAVTATLPAGTESVRFRVTPSGHGFDNNVYCAEFCERDYALRINGTEQFRQSMWRDDCGYNPVYPQAGTWLYDRANWCPGSEAWTYFHEYTPPGSASSLDIDLDIDAYTWVGTQTPSYLLDAQLISYGAFQHEVDAEIADILEPSSNYAHARFNPSCGRPKILLGNNGGSALTSCTIAYGVDGGALCYQNWEGNLAYGETELVELGNINWTGVDLSDPYFFARVENPNNTADEVAWNNEKRTSFEVVPLYDNRFVVWMRTNARPAQNAWTITNDLGEIVASRMVFDGPFTIHEDTVDLPNGCYLFTLTDSEKDGLEFFGNSDGTGIIRFARVSSGFMATFDANFGTRIDHAFTTGLPLGNVNSSESCDATGLSEPGLVPGIGSLGEATLKAYPNPARETVTIELMAPQRVPMHCSLRNLTGQTIWEKAFDTAMFQTTTIPLMGLTPGIYVLDALAGNQRLARLISVE